MDHGSFPGDSGKDLLLMGDARCGFDPSGQKIPGGEQPLDVLAWRNPCEARLQSWSLKVSDTTEQMRLQHSSGP